MSFELIVLKSMKSTLTKLLAMPASDHSTVRAIVAVSELDTSVEWIRDILNMSSSGSYRWEGEQ